MDLDECYNVETEELELKEPVNSGYTNWCFTGEYENTDCFIKVSESLDMLEKESEALELIENSTSIKAPSHIDTIRSDGIYALVTTLVDINEPTSEDWENKEFCRGLVQSGADVINQILCNSELQSSARSSDSCSTYVSRVDDLYRSARNRLTNGNSKRGKKARTLDAVHQSMKSYGFNRRFSHNDFTINNYGYSDGVEPIFDWENAGFYDPLFDISSFETGIIGEYVGYFHSETFTKEMRKEYHNQLNYNIENTNKYRLFKLFNVLSVIGYLNQSAVSDIWVSTLDDAIAVKEKQYQDLIHNTNLG